MKEKHGLIGRSRFWVKLVSALVGVGIVLVLVMGAVLSALRHNTKLQRDLDDKSAEFQLVSEQLAEATSELAELKSALAEKVTELEMATIVVTESHIELYAFNWAQQIAACVLEESRNLSEYLIDGDRQLSAAESIRNADYQAFIEDQAVAESPMRDYCIQGGIDKTMLNIWWERAFARTESETGLERTEALEFLQSFGGILVPNSTVIVYTDQILGDISALVGDWAPEMSDSIASRLWFDR